MSYPANPPSYNQAVEAPGTETKGQDPAYPSQAAGYPPQQPGYQAQQPGYPPQQPGYQAQPPPAGYQQPPAAGYPQQPQYTAGYPAPPTTVIVGQPTTHVTTVVHQIYRDFPVQTTCPNCQNNVTTVVRKEPGAFAWILCLIIAFFGGWMGCCLIPFCVDGCMDCTHTCPVCKYQISHYNRM
ncbi:cell death-inducing p53-target protein 1 homolog [Anneissia japonica]|uniref:cell death-inducing p53-target protein 1 homolog n=1 Tax=Anneissia japonica TaxID=1529436 RepID=UPI001425810B|nr:cell death-inducing p53-target protein 1 homolog [Anneissia japonica]